MNRLRYRRVVVAVFTLIIGIVTLFIHEDNYRLAPQNSSVLSEEGGSHALEALASLDVKGRAPKTGYKRDEFGAGWANDTGCDTRNVILRRDLKEVKLDENCRVLSGVLDDPYTGKVINFQRGPNTSPLVQIDHVVALSNAWQTGAQQLSRLERIALANDPLELLAVDGAANQQKGDGDAATWLPENKTFRCQYVARQIAIKKKYHLWVTFAEKEAIARVLTKCPAQTLPKAVYN